MSDPRHDNELSEPEEDREGAEVQTTMVAFDRAHRAIEELVTALGTPEAGSGADRLRPRPVRRGESPTLRREWGLDAAAWRAIDAVAPEQARRLRRLFRRHVLQVIRQRTDPR